MNKWILALLLALPTIASANEEEFMPRDQGMWQTVVMLAICVVFFYFILWRPEQKRRKMLDNQRDAMQKGDRVVAMGIVGTVQSIKEETVILRMVDGAKIEVLKGAITDVTSGAGAEVETA